MINLKNRWLVLVVLFSAGLVWGKDVSIPDYFIRQAELQLAFMDGAAEMNANIPMMPHQTKRKKAGLGVLMSAVVPGTGQMYGGSWIKGSLLLAAEIGLWTAHSHFNAEGKDWENKFQNYADTYWDEMLYWNDVADLAEDQGIAVFPEITEDNYNAYIDALRDAEHQLPFHTHSLPHTKTQQYYEMIGKYYNQFGDAWTDKENYPEDGGRDHYESMRHKSNQFFIKGSNCAMVVLANHVFSALDAAWTIKRYNQRLDARLKASMIKFNSEPLPFLTLELKW